MNVFKQPLLQFLLLGAAIFAGERAMLGDQDDPRRILIDDAKYAEIAGIYQDNQGRAPSEQEMATLTIKWAQNEVLYREAQLMGLDKGDEMIRQRLILKLRNVLFNRVSAEPPSEQVLREWFELNRAKYDRPETYDFEQFKVGGTEAQAQAEKLAARLGTRPPEAPWQDTLRKYRQRPKSNLDLVFGERSASELINNADQRWLPVSSPAGWHLSRVTARHPGRPADFGAIRTRVVEEWKAQAMQVELAEALRAIAARYDIRLELTAPPESWNARRLEQVKLDMGAGK